MKGKWTEIYTRREKDIPKDKKCDICFDADAIRGDKYLYYCEKCWVAHEEDKKCVVCGSRDNLLGGTNFSRNYICKDCLRKQELSFAKDMEEALYGKRKVDRDLHKA